MDLRESVVLENSRVLLRPWRLDDVGSIRQIALDPEIWRRTTGCLRDEKDIDCYLSRAVADHQAGKRLPFAVIEKKSQSVVGSSSLGNASAIDRRIEIGWTWLGVRWQGKGVNANVKYLLLDYCFEKLRAHRVEFKTDALNARAIKALLKIGAKEDGTLRSHTLMHDGRYRDTVYLSILEDEWSTVEQKLRRVVDVS